MQVLGIDSRSSGRSMSALDCWATSQVTRTLITWSLLSMWFQGLLYPWNSWSLRLPISGMSSSWLLNTECFQLLFSGSPLSSTIQTHSSNGMEKRIPRIASIRVTRHRDHDADSRCYLTCYWIKLDWGCRTLDVKSSPCLVIFFKLACVWIFSDPCSAAINNFVASISKTELFLPFLVYAPSVHPHEKTRELSFTHPATAYIYRLTHISMFLLIITPKNFVCLSQWSASGWFFVCV